jgi:hypothetical protein
MYAEEAKPAATAPPADQPPAAPPTEPVKPPAADDSKVKFHKSYGDA